MCNGIHETFFFFCSLGKRTKRRVKNHVRVVGIVLRNEELCMTESLSLSLQGLCRAVDVKVTVGREWNMAI